MMSMATSIRLPRRRARERGFTMAEVLVSLIVFVIAVVAIVALQARGIEAQRAADELREGERVAQRAMNELQSRGFEQLAMTSFVDPQAVAANLPYSDTNATRQLVDYRGLPNADGTAAPGQRSDFYAVWRTIRPIPFTANTPLEVNALTGLELEVLVMWVDYSNSAFPPPANVTPAALVPANATPGDPAYMPYVQQVRLRTVRMNDTFSPAPPTP